MLIDYNTQTPLSYKPSIASGWCYTDVKTDFNIPPVAARFVAGDEFDDPGWTTVTFYVYRDSSVTNMRNICAKVKGGRRRESRHICINNDENKNHEFNEG
ncbi:hypothetical protein X994_6340 (plasmid) [Burkholderia pseudomallei]|uniref:hypothetical protein n=1 Tax=Burkholderia pseudomallei TaxID=28450 RepID=UPI00052A6645|nr:hypothetical protein [Burkholderia pseudomallei]AIV73680.1 hypothetical protein X994_6340 [Burkholderia pseudomallei]